MTKILVIEDDRDIIENLLDILGSQELNFKVLTALNGAEGLERILQDAPDLIICDINMPQMNGFELLKQVRDRKILSPFIFLSAEVGIDKIRKGMSLGADDYLTKPFSRRTLLDAVYSRLDRLQDVRDFIDTQKSEARREILKGIPDELGNLVNGISLTFHELYEAQSAEEAVIAYQDGIKTIATLAATLKAYYLAVSRLS